MDSDFNDLIQKHVAGQSVIHAGPYSELEIPVSKNIPDQEFINKWILPFYLTWMKDAEEFLKHYQPIRKEIDKNLVTDLLVWFNWRSRLVGAYFAAIEGLTSLTEHIGRLLLRSDVVYAGDGYALALATFNSQQAIEFLNKYLSHYLDRTDLVFNQGEVMSAMIYLDKVNNTNLADKYLPKWQNFENQNSSISLAKELDEFELKVKNIKIISES
jgi:hypothetical protein